MGRRFIFVFSWALGMTETNGMGTICNVHWSLGVYHSSNENWTKTEIRSKTICYFLPQLLNLLQANKMFTDRTEVRPLILQSSLALAIKICSYLNKKTKRKKISEVESTYSNWMKSEDMAATSHMGSYVTLCQVRMWLFTLPSFSGSCQHYQ